MHVAIIQVTLLCMIFNKQTKINYEAETCIYVLFLFLHSTQLSAIHFGLPSHTDEF